MKFNPPPTPRDFLGRSEMLQSELNCLLEHSFEKGEALLPGDDIYPDPSKISEGFIVAFKSWFDGGLCVPLYPLLLSLMEAYDVELHHLSPELILRLNTFRWLCETVLNEPPSIELLHKIFFLELQHQEVPECPFGCVAMKVRNSAKSKYPLLTYHQKGETFAEFPSKWFYIRLPDTSCTYSGKLPSLKEVKCPQLDRLDNQLTKISKVRSARSSRDLVEEMLMADEFSMKTGPVTYPSANKSTSALVPYEQAKAIADKLLGRYKLMEHNLYKKTVDLSTCHNIIADALNINIPLREVPLAVVVVPEDLGDGSKHRPSMPLTEPIGSKRRDGTDALLDLQVSSDSESSVPPGSRKRKAEDSSAEDLAGGPHLRPPKTKTTSAKDDKEITEDLQPVSIREHMESEVSPNLCPHSIGPAELHPEDIIDGETMLCTTEDMSVTGKYTKGIEVPPQGAVLADVCPSSTAEVVAGTKGHTEARASTGEEVFVEVSNICLGGSTAEATVPNAAVTKEGDVKMRATTSGEESAKGKDLARPAAGTVGVRGLVKIQLVFQDDEDVDSNSEKISLAQDDQVDMDGVSFPLLPTIIPNSECYTKNLEEVDHLLAKTQQLLMEAKQGLHNDLSKARRKLADQENELVKARWKLVDQEKELARLKRDLGTSQEKIAHVEQRAKDAEDKLKVTQQREMVLQQEQTETSTLLHMEASKVHKVLQKMMPAANAPTPTPSVSESFQQLASQVGLLEDASRNYARSVAGTILTAGVAAICVKTKKGWEALEERADNKVRKYIEADELLPAAADRFAVTMLPELKTTGD